MLVFGYFGNMKYSKNCLVLHTQPTHNWSYRFLPNSSGEFVLQPREENCKFKYENVYISSTPKSLSIPQNMRIVFDVCINLNTNRLQFVIIQPIIGCSVVIYWLFAETTDIMKIDLMRLVRSDFMSFADGFAKFEQIHIRRDIMELLFDKNGILYEFSKIQLLTNTINYKIMYTVIVCTKFHAFPKR